MIKMLHKVLDGDVSDGLKWAACGLLVLYAIHLALWYIGG